MVPRMLDTRKILGLELIVICVPNNSGKCVED